jgi:hypothetical protein
VLTALAITLVDCVSIRLGLMRPSLENAVFDEEWEAEITTDDYLLTAKGARSCGADLGSANSGPKRTKGKVPSRLTHTETYATRNEQAPQCDECDRPLTVEDIHPKLIDFRAGVSALGR